jgi:hypothetical protein
MGLTEAMQFLEAEEEKLLERSEEVRGLYRSLADSLRTLPLLFRNSFAPELALKAALDPQAERIAFPKATLQSSEGETADNTRRLAGLLNNLEVIRGRLLADPRLLELAELADIRRVHADAGQFLQELFQQNSAWLLRDPNAEAAALARSKRKDVEELVGAQLEPFAERLGSLRRDGYGLRLRREVAAHVGGPQGQPQAEEALLKDKCACLGLSFDPELSQGVLRDLAVSDEALEARLREKYEQKPEVGKEAKAAGLRQKYLRIAYRYLDRLRDLERLQPVLEAAYAVFQPKPSLLEHLSRFFALLAGRKYRGPHRDVEYSYILSRESIENHRASLESLLAEVNRLEKAMLRVKSSLASARAARSLKTIPPARLRSVIDSTRTSLRRVYDDGFGLVQWLGRKSNREKLARLPDGAQRDLSGCLEAIYATLIVNAERLAQVDRRYPGQGAPAAGEKPS